MRGGRGPVSSPADGQRQQSGHRETRRHHIEPGGVSARHALQPADRKRADYRTPGADIYAVYPQQLQMTARVKACVDMLIETLGAR